MQMRITIHKLRLTQMIFDLKLYMLGGKVDELSK